MNNYTKTLVENFDGNNYEDFISYVYKTLTKKSNSCKEKQKKNKYLNIRNDILKYIIANKNIITSELRKR
jgi:hypothetical protein